METVCYFNPNPNEDRTAWGQRTSIGITIFIKTSKALEFLKYSKIVFESVLRGIVLNTLDLPSTLYRVE